MGGQRLGGKSLGQEVDFGWWVENRGALHKDLERDTGGRGPEQRRSRILRNGRCSAKSKVDGDGCKRSGF